jgi:hypothetical protein
VDLRPTCRRPVSLRVILASFLPRYQAGPGGRISCQMLRPIGFREPE